jgi:hypothetical protein
MYVAVEDYLEEVSDGAGRIVGIYIRHKDAITKALIKHLGSAKALQTYKDKYDNKSLNDLVLNRNVGERAEEKGGRMIRKYRIAYAKPTSRFGRAHLYAPIKQLGNLEIDTLWYNVAAIWLYTFLLYLALRTDLLRKAITFSERRKLTRNQAT